MKRVKDEDMLGSKTYQIIYTPGTSSNRPDRVAIEMKAQHLGRDSICAATDRVRPGFVDYKLIRAKEKISPAFMFRNRLGKTYEAVPQVCVPSQSRYFLLELPQNDNIAHLYPVNEYYTTTLNLTRDPDSVPIKEDDDDAEVKDEDDEEDSGSDVDVEPEDDDEDSGKSKALDPLKEIELQNTARFNKEKKKKLKEAEVPVDKPKEKIVMITPTLASSSATSSSSSSSSSLMDTGVKREREGGEPKGQPDKKRRKNQVSQKSIASYFAKNGPRIATSRLEKHRRKKCLTPEMQEEFDEILRAIAEIVEFENKKYYTLKQSKSSAFLGLPELGPQ